MLRGQVALVTGASRGIGRGIALQLGEAGCTVYVTGREPKKSDSQDGGNLPTLEKTAKEISQRGGIGIAAYCDHSDSNDVKKLFDRIQREQNGKLDILVNNAYSAVNALVDNAGKKFWELEPSIWDDVNNVGLRNHYFCSVYAARMMVPRKAGLIVNISSIGGLKHLFNVAYGVGKEANDRMAADMAHELRKHNITAISLWPGAVKTEIFTSKIEGGKMPDLKAMVEDGETTEFSGRAVVHLATDEKRMQKTGRILLTADLADEYGFTDIDGRHPPSFRSVKQLLKFAKWDRTSYLVPGWVKLPGWMIMASASKL